MSGLQHRPGRGRRPLPLGSSSATSPSGSSLCIVAGIALGQLFPASSKRSGAWRSPSVNVPVGVLIWVMIIPMLVKIDFGALHQVRRHWRGIGVTLFVNWAVKPFSMALLGWLFVRHVFAPYLPAGSSTVTSPA